MPNRTFLELQNAVKQEMQLDPGLISDEERKQFINDCINDLGNIALFEKEVTLSSVGGVISTPTDLVSPILVRLASDNRYLKPLSMSVMPATGDNPIGYIYKFNTIELYPKPTSEHSIKLYYAYRPAQLVSDTDIPDIPEGWDHLIVDYAVAKAHRKNGNISMFREYMSYYEAKKANLVSELMRRLNARVVETVNKEGAPVNPVTEILLNLD